VKLGLANPELGIALESLDAAKPAGTPIVDTLLAIAVMHPIDSIRIGAIETASFPPGVNPSSSSWDHRDEMLGLTTGDRDARRAASQP
jgi:hypothetical protein